MPYELAAMIAIKIVLDLTWFRCCQNYPLKLGPYRPVKMFTGLSGSNSKDDLSLTNLVVISRSLKFNWMNLD